MKKVALTIAAAAMVAFAGSAMAAQPDGTFVDNPGEGEGVPQACGPGASGIIQNGQFVSGNYPPGVPDPGIDQTTVPASRANTVFVDCDLGPGKMVGPP